MAAIQTYSRDRECGRIGICHFPGQYHPVLDRLSKCLGPRFVRFTPSDVLSRHNLVSEPLDRHEVVTRTALGAIQGLDQIPHTRPRLFAVRNTIALRVMPLPLRCQRLNLRAGYESNSNFPHFGIPTLAGRITALLTVVLYDVDLDIVSTDLGQIRLHWSPDDLFQLRSNVSYSVQCRTSIYNIAKCVLTVIRCVGITIAAGLLPLLPGVVKCVNADLPLSARNAHNLHSS